MIYVVKGNTIRDIALPLQLLTVEQSGETITNYYPSDTDVIEVNMVGAYEKEAMEVTVNENYLHWTWTPEKTGCYGIEVRITQESGIKMRSYRKEQVCVVCANEQLPDDDGTTEFAADYIVLENVTVVWVQGEPGQDADIAAAEAATTAANDAATLANQKAALANSAAETATNAASTVADAVANVNTAIANTRAAINTANNAASSANASAANADAATTAANNAAELANTKAGLANTAATTANTAATNANNKATLANTKAGLANTAATAANDAAELANTKAGLANTAATAANDAAELANTKAGLANTAATAANDAAELANTKAGLANTAATAANDAADLANTKAGLANTAATAANDAATAATAAAAYNNELNISAIYPTGGTDSGSTYTLANAIAKVASSARKEGLKVTFISDGTDSGLDSGVPYTFVYYGTSWSAENFKQIDHEQVEEVKESVDDLSFVGGVVTKTGTTALDQAGVITSSGAPTGPGTSNPSAWANYLRTDYITIYRATRVVAYRCQNNTTTFTPAAVYDADKNFISRIPIDSSNGDFDIQVSSYPNAAYIMFCGWASGNANNDNFYYTIYYQNGRVTDLEQQVTTNTADITTIKGDIGYTLKDITDTATWTNGYYSASDGTMGTYNSNVWWMAGKCATFDITDYDVVNFTNALYQKTYCMIAYILGDGVLIDTIKGTGVEPEYPSGNIYLDDYKGYTQVLMRINGAQNISIKATKNASWETTDLKRIVLDGDSLCNRVGPQLMKICHRFGYRLLNRSQGGENLIGNLTRAGGLMFRVAQEFTMPANGSVSVSLTSTWIDSNGNYSSPPYGTISTARDVWIAGIKGELTLSNSVFTFTRSESGTSFKVGTGVECYDNSLVTDKDYIHIWFSGQNDGYERNDEQYANLTDSASKFFNEKFIVVTTHTSVCTASLAKAAREKFGSKYLNIRDYLDGNAIYDALRWGLLSDTSLTPSDWESEMLTDTVHQDDVCAYIEAVQFWNRLVDLGYVDGDRVDDAQTFFNPTNAQLSSWYGTPQNGYGEYNYPF